MESHEERRLTTILSADVVGYTRLMAADETGTHARLRTHRKELLDPKTAEHHGRIVKLTGDGALMEFASVVNAVKFAVDVQRAMIGRNAAVPEDRQITFRIGINIGDVIAEGDDLYGNGVNVAVRLEGLAEPGGICVSGKVFEEVKNKLQLGIEDLGEQEVKNIPEPVQIYRVLLNPASAGQMDAPRVQSAMASRRRVAAWGGAAAIVVVLLLAAGVGLWPSQFGADPPERTAQSTTMDTHRVAVLPFANMSPDAENQYFSDGLTEELITRLSKIGELRVIARTSIMKYKGTNKSIAEIGRELGVGTILEGSVRKAENRVRINAQLIDVVSEEHIWVKDYDREFEDIFAIQSDISRQVTEALKVTMLADERVKIDNRYTTNVRAYNLYLQARYHWHKFTAEGFQKAQEYFEQAIAIDPSFALAYAGLSDVYGEIVWHLDISAEAAYSRARAAAQKALELDDTIAEAHTALALVKLQYDWDWSGAETALERAISLNPNYSMAHALLGQKLLSPVWGRYDEAIAEVRLAQDLDPLSFGTSEKLGFVLWQAGRWDESIEQFQKTLELDPDGQLAHMGLGYNYSAKGMHEEAILSYQKVVELTGGWSAAVGWLGWAYGMAGHKEKALQALDQLKERAKKEKIPAAAFAYVYMGLGEKDQAFNWLDKAYEERSIEMLFLRVSHNWNSLRSDPRFTELLRKIGFTKLSL